MLKNYLILAFRHLKRKKGFAFINIAGMGVSLTVVLVILQYVVQETSYDSFHEKLDRTYRVVGTMTQAGKESAANPGSHAPLSVAVAAQVPEIETYARFDRIDYTNVSLTNKSEATPRQVFQGNFYIVDSTFFEVLSFDLISGDKRSALTKPENMVITESVAKKLFGAQDPMGREVEMGNNWGKYTFQVSGVMKDPPFNSHLSPQVLIPLTFYDKINVKINDWENSYLGSYVVLNSPQSLDLVTSAYNSIYQEHRPESQKNQGVDYEYSLQPMADVYLHSSFEFESAKTGNFTYVVFISIVGALVLIISWVNYVNLATAQSVERAREVGIRKVFGSLKRQLISQFLFESMLINAISVVLALTLAQSLLGRIGNWTGIEIHSTLIAEPLFWVCVVLFWLTASFFAGFYPAFILSGYRPSRVLGGRFKSDSKGVFLRRSLVIFQFAVSALLIAGTITVYRQISYMRSQDLGININDVVVLKSPPSALSSVEFNKKVNYFKTELLRNPQFAAMTTASTMPGHKIGWTSTKMRRKGEAEGEGASFSLIACDKDYLKALSISLMAGEFFQGHEQPWVTGEIVINKRAAEMLGYQSPEEALYQHLVCPVFGGADLRIIGVTDDYHHQALQSSIEPVIYVLSNWSNYYLVKLNLKGTAEEKTTALAPVLSSLESSWKEAFPESTFNYSFLDEQFNQQYKADQQFGALFTLFSAFAIFIGCMGLFGLASYTLYQKTKEIGIRKVLGARYGDIMVLVSKEFLLLVLMGNLVAIPAGWWLVSNWLEGYAYRIEIGWWFVAIPVTSLLVLTFLTILFQVLKAVRLNPVESLRYE
ncbi:MAG: ABC transporter permease [Imperialibacter sp.]|uniref:ABC transporter permease n=1 Tax=Imperialibacter sp. TaxID=2038411 RepID=UPI0032EBD470